MRNVVSKIVAVAVVVAGIVGASFSPVFADGGSTPLDVSDGRYAPFIGDRVAVYVYDAGVDVWGIDGETNGKYLTTFSLSELASGASVTHQVNGGAITLTMNSNATWTEGYADYDATEIVTQVVEPAVYTVSWVDSAIGATGVGAFSKTFDAVYIAE